MSTDAQLAYYAKRRKLTQHDIQEARAMYNTPNTSQRPTMQALAHKYGVSIATMFRALKSPRTDYV